MSSKVCTGWKTTLVWECVFNADDAVQSTTSLKSQNQLGGPEVKRVCPLCFEKVIKGDISPYICDRNSKEREGGKEVRQFLFLTS